MARGGWRILLLVVAALGLVANPPVGAHGQGFCADGQELTSGAAYRALQPLLAEVIGEPVECEHAGPQGDLLQVTSAGLAFAEAGSATPNFTNGAEHWALIDGDLMYWTDVVAAAPAQPAPAPDQPVADQPTGPPPGPLPPPAPGPVLLAWQDTAGGPYLFFAKRRCSYAVEAFNRASARADVGITYSPNVDDPLDKPNQVRLLLEWPGVATTRTVAGAVAVAQVGAASVHWTSYTDRVVQDIILPARPVAARLDEQLTGQGVVTSRDSAGAYQVTDATNARRFFVHVPTMVDAGGQTRPALLSWNPPSATIALDPVFLSTAAYPVTVSLIVEYGTVYC